MKFCQLGIFVKLGGIVATSIAEDDLISFLFKGVDSDNLPVGDGPGHFHDSMEDSQVIPTPKFLELFNVILNLSHEVRGSEELDDLLKRNINSGGGLDNSSSLYILLPHSNFLLALEGPLVAGIKEFHSCQKLFWLFFDVSLVGALHFLTNIFLLDLMSESHIYLVIRKK